MAKYEDLEDRLFTLKKRFRDPELKEIYEARSRSIVEVYNKVYNKQPLNTTSNITHLPASRDKR